MPLLASAGPFTCAKNAAIDAECIQPSRGARVENDDEPENHPHPAAALRPDLALGIHHLTMLLQLPDGGIRNALPDADSCRDQFIRTRWPEGTVCPSCGGRSIHTLPSRDLLLCRQCRRQFTATSGTALHRTRLSLQMWLLATEAVIRWQPLHHVSGGITVDALGSLLGVHTEAAARMRRIITADLGLEGEGLLRRAVCMQTLSLPPEITVGTSQHFELLVARAFPFPDRPLT